MKINILTFALLLISILAGAQSPFSVSISDNCSQNGKKIELRSSGTENGYTWINLGLSVQWATMNVGATASEDYGYYFAWGETAEKSNYSWSTYKYCKGTATTMTKYCKDSYYGTVDNKTVLDLEDDAARVNWGGEWRMPTDAEWTELREQCTWKWTTQNNIKGHLVTAKNGNSIFLPAAGCRYDTNPFHAGSLGYYWSSSLSEYGSSSACNIYFDSYDVAKDYDDRYSGQSVRSVCQSTSSSATGHTITLYADGCDTPNLIYCPEGQQLSVSATPMEHRHFVKWNDGNTDNPRLATSNQNITYTALFEDDFTIQVGCQNGKVEGVSSPYYKPNDKVVLTAVPDFGYHFVQWTDGITENPRTVIVTQDTIFYAEIVKDFEGECGQNLKWK